MKERCDICNRNIETHLQRQKKGLCFSCLTEEATDGGAVPAFNLKQKPVLAHCPICDSETHGTQFVASPWGFICKECGDLCETQTGVSWEDLRLSSKAEWLVKANNRICGPFTKEEIEIGIRENRFMPVDEIERSFGRWGLIRNEELFRHVVNEMKNRQNTKSDREVTEAVGTEGVTTPIDISDLMPHLSTKPAGQAETPDNTRDLLKIYVAPQDHRVQQEISSAKLNKILWSLAVLLLAGVLAAIKFTKPNTSHFSDRQKSFQDLMESGLRAEKVGDFSKAFNSFTEARSLKSNDQELLLHLAPLTLNYDRQMIQASRMFKEILEQSKEPNYQKSAYLGLGLIAMQSHDFDEALQMLNKAAQIDQNYVPALINLGILYNLKNDFNMAEGKLLDAISKNGTDGVLMMALADVALSLSERENDWGRLTQAVNVLTHYMSTIRDYRQEVLVQMMRLNSHISKFSAEKVADKRALREAKDKAQKQIPKLIVEFLDSDPENTDLHLRHWGVYRERASWGTLSEYLKAVTDDLNPTARTNAALGLAIYKSQEKLEGAERVRQALSQASSDPLILSISAWVEQKLGREEVASEQIEQAIKNAEALKLPNILKARLSADKEDFDVAKTYWEKVKNLDSRSAEAMHGLAQVEWAKKNIIGARTWALQARVEDANYIPLLKLFQDLDVESNLKSGVGE